MLETRTGNTLSSEPAEAANLYQQAVDLILGSESGAAEALDKALQLDKDFAIAAAARYYVANDVVAASPMTFEPDDLHGFVNVAPLGTYALAYHSNRDYAVIPGAATVPAVLILTTKILSVTSTIVHGPEYGIAINGLESLNS